MFSFGCASDGNAQDSVYREMIERSLISGGNNFRTKQLLEKAANGEEITLAYIGGSITEGFSTTPAGSYVEGSYEKFISGFAGGNGGRVHLVNAGMSGTPSTLGIIRYKRDVLGRAPTPPDMVVIEFAVNDWDDPTGGAAYESLVREILEADNAPAVILLFSVSRSLWNLQDRFIPIGKRYRLPMISIKDAIAPALEAGTLTKDGFFRDEYHPNAHGFQIMTDCIINYLSVVHAQSKAAADITLPRNPVSGIQFCGMKMIDADHLSGAAVEAGGFTETDTAVRTFTYDGSAKIFPANWYKKSAAAGSPFRLTLTCKNLFIVYKLSRSSAFGTARVFIDGDPEPLEILIANKADAWDKPWTVLLFDDPVAAAHSVEVRMEEASADKRFTILAFGYTE